MYEDLPHKFIDFRHGQTASLRVFQCHCNQTRIGEGRFRVYFAICVGLGLMVLLFTLLCRRSFNNRMRSYLSSSDKLGLIEVGLWRWSSGCDGIRNNPCCHTPLHQLTLTFFLIRGQGITFRVSLTAN